MRLTYHTLQESGHLKGKTHAYNPAIALVDILKKDSHYQSSRLRERLIEEKYFEAKCYVCGLIEWQGKAIALELEHISGDNTNNCIENLTLLCPNCHAQTNTYRGKNKKYTIGDTLPKQPKLKIYKPEYRYQIKLCKDCSKEISDGAIRCKPCAGKINSLPKIIWPNKEELEKLVWEQSTWRLAKHLGVSDKAIEKHCKQLGIDKPGPGYWTKKRFNKI
jgi:Zn finger protein HypA/HybF involved in hydrogenase expression